jgi:acyl transferase domain-containing protein
MEHILGEYSQGAVLLEVGPNQALSTLSRQQPLDLKRHFIVSTLPHVKNDVSSARAAVTALGQLWLHGVPIDWQAIYQGEKRRRVHLPKYRFQRSRYSFETELADRKVTSDNLPATSIENAASSTTPGQLPANSNDRTQETNTNVDGNDSTRLPASRAQARTVIAQQMDLMNRQMALLTERRRRTQ